MANRVRCDGIETSRAIHDDASASCKPSWEYVLSLTADPRTQVTIQVMTKTALFLIVAHEDRPQSKRLLGIRPT